MKKIFTTFAVSIFMLDCLAQTFHVTTPGTLESVIDAAMADAEDLNVYELKVTGKINGKDIKYIRASDGYLANMTSLDLQEVEIVSSDDCYYSNYNGEKEYYYGEPKETVIYNGAAISRTKYYSKDLQFAFCNMNKLKKIVLPKTINALGESIFKDDVALETVVWPSEVSKIGKSAFYGCTSMTGSLNLENITDMGEYCFYKCCLTDLKLSPNLIEIPNAAFSMNNFESLDLSYCKDLRKIGTCAFYDCVSLTNFIMPDGLMELGDFVFDYCRKLENVYIPSSICRCGIAPFGVSYKANPYKSKLTLKGGFEWINNCIVDVTSDFQMSAELVIPDGVTSISVPFSTNGFSDNCEIVTSLILPSSLKYIGKACFASFTGLTELIIPDSVECIKQSAFLGCSNITSLKLPEQLSELGSGSFGSCKGLTQITIPKSLKKVSYEENDYVNISCLNIRSSVGTFSNCTGLIRVLWSPITCEFDVDNGFFYRCTSIKQLNFGDSVKVIPGNLLYGSNDGSHFKYPKIESITIPSTVEIIKDKAFYYCSNLSKLYIKAVNAKFGYLSFNNTLENVIVCGTVQNARWNFRKATGYNALGYANTDKTNVTDVVFEVPSNLIYLDDSFAYSLWRDSLPVGVTYAGKVAVAYNATSSSSSAKPMRAATQGEAVEIADGTVCIAGGFAYNQKIASISIPQSVVSIGPNAFTWATLKSIELSENISEIGKDAFKNCNSLSDIYSPSLKPANIIAADTIMKIGSFDGITPSKITLHVYAESYNAYCSAVGWKDFNVVGDLTTGIEESLVDDEGTVIITDNGINVADDKAIVCVYNISGQCIYDGKGGNIPLSSGLYIVKVDGKTSKVSIR